MKKVKYAIIPILSVIIFSCIFSSFLDKKIEQLIQSKDLASLRHTYDEKSRDNGTYFMNYFASRGDLLLLGSSELKRQVEGNPVNIFPCEGNEFDVSIYGIAHMQDLNQAIRIGACDGINKDSKVALIVSMQWFNKECGLMDKQFLSCFSDTQFYNFLANPNISEKNKKYLAQRISNLTSVKSDYKDEKILASLYLRDNLGEEILYYLMLPYYKLKAALLDTRDKLLVYRALTKSNEKTETEIKDIDFQEKYKEAIKKGSEQVTEGNPFNVQDKFYNKELKNNKCVYEGRDKKIDLLSSKEFEDYEFFFDVCDDLGVKPYIILMNVNGWYYDYLGITEEKRTKFYDKLESMALQRGYDVLNLQPNEYEKYYLIDTMHLGWVGWLNVSQELSKQFKGE